jgi:hypothetical protein
MNSLIRSAVVRGGSVFELPTDEPLNHLASISKSTMPRLFNFELLTTPLELLRLLLQPHPGGKCQLFLDNDPCP